MKRLNIGTVFSGIGAPEQAFIKMGYKLNILGKIPWLSK